MNQSAPALTPDKQPGDDSVGPAKFDPRKNSPMRFTYKSGSSPLDGYTIKRGVGAGGFGEVYYATTQSGKEVALKHIQRNLEIEMRGAKHCLNLKHPHLVSLFDIRYDAEGEGWIVMEYVHGDSLQDVIERHPHGMPRDDALSWFKAVASAVNYLHDHGIVHRDLKPGNIFNDAGTVKIGDYGLSKFISVSRRSGQTESVGTFHYMAPEIGKGCYGREIDVYALGIILFEMLTGRVPFEGESSQEIIMKHLTANPDLGDVQEPFRSTIAAALHKDPEKRIPTAEEMLRRLGLQEVAGKISTVGSTGAPSGNSVGNANAVPPPIETVPAVLVPANAAGDAPTGTLNDEPIALAVRKASDSFLRWWNDHNTSTPVKFLVLVIVAFGLISNLPILLPLAMMFGGAYLAYLMIRLLVIAFQDPPTTKPAAAPGNARSQRYHPQAMKRKHRACAETAWHPKRKDRERAAFASRSTRVRVQELVGSLIVSGVMAVIVSCVLLLISQGGPPALDRAALLAQAPMVMFFTGMTTLGSWLILIAAKRWEDRRGEETHRRIMMTLIGIALAVLAWFVVPVLFLPGAELGGLAGAMGEGSRAFTSVLLFFALSFLVPRWWKRADPLRPTRLSIWKTGMVVLWATLLTGFWPWMQPWGIMLVGAIAVTVQLSAPWWNQARRDEMRQAYEQGLQETTLIAPNRR